MKHKKLILYGICIFLIGSFVLNKLYNNKSKDSKKSAVANYTPKDKVIKEATNTKSTEELKAAVSGNGKDFSTSDVSKLDITMDGTTPNTVGNSSGNLANEGYFAVQGKWMYFTLPRMNLNSYPIYRVMKDGETGLKALTKPGSMACINVIGDWIYYINGAYSSSPSINRTKTDGTITEEVLPGPVFGMYIKSGYIYYISYDGVNNGIYKLKLDVPIETKGELIAKAQKDTNFNYLYVTSISIYTTIVHTDNTLGVSVFSSNLYSMNLDGTNLKKISNDNLDKCIIYNNYIYYINVDNRRLYRINLDGTNKVQILSDPIFNYNVDINNIYFTEGIENQNNILKSNLDGKNIVKLTHNTYSNNKEQGATVLDSVQGIYCIDDSIFYLGNVNVKDSINLLRVKIDGSFEKQLN